MKPVFADSVYFFALLNARDRRHKRAARYAAQATNPILTTAWVLTEVADGLCDHAARHAVVRLWQTLQSAADCISFVVIEERGLAQALTTDHHFQQAGFATLLG